MMPALRNLGSFVRVLSVAGLSVLVGCAAPTDEEVDSAGGAATASQVASSYDFKEELFADEPASDAVTALGAVSWTAFQVVNDKFFGLAHYAIDKNGDVRFAVLQSARAKADGKTMIFVGKLDKSGTEASPVSRDVMVALVADVLLLRPRLQAKAKANEDPKVRACAKLAITALTAAAITVPLGGGTVMAASQAGEAGLLGVAAIGATMQTGALTTYTAYVSVDALRKTTAACAK